MRNSALSIAIIVVGAAGASVERPPVEASAGLTTAQVQMIINNSAGGTAVIPPGTHVVRGLVVPSNTRITGAPGRTTLRLEPDDASHPRDPILQILGSSVTIDNLTFDGDRANQLPTFANSWNGRSDSPAILIDPPVPPYDGIEIRDCTFIRTVGSPIAARDLTNFTVADNRFEYVTYEAVFLDSAPPTPFVSRNITITGNVAIDVATPSSLNGVVNTRNAAGANAFLVNNVDGLEFAGNYAENIQRNLIKAQSAANARIWSNQVFDNDHALTFSGLQLADYSHHVEIFDNELGFVWRGIALNTTGGHDISIDGNLLHDIADTGILVADQTLGPNVRIRYNALNRVGEDAIRVASGANGVTVERNQAWRGTAPNAKHAFWFESRLTPVTSLVVTNNCFFGYDGGTTNHGAVFIDNEHEDGSVGGSGVRIESNRVESSTGKRTIWVGPNPSPNVSGWLRYNGYYPSTAIAPSSVPAGMQVHSNSVASFPPGVCTVL